MADLINTKISAQMPVMNVFSPSQKELKIDKSKSGKLEKLKLPVSLIAGGGLLIYLGVRRPSVNSIFKKIVKSHLLEMEKEIPLYFEKTDKAISEFVENSLDDIYNFKQFKLNEMSTKIEKFDDVSDPMDLIKKQNSVFEVINHGLNPYMNAGAGDFDKYFVKIHSKARVLLNELSAQRYQSKLKMEDLLQINSSKEFIQSSGEKVYNDAYQNAQIVLKDNISELSAKMEKYTDSKIKNAVNFQSKIMANIITELRDLHVETKKEILTKAFEKMSEIAHLDKFSPSFKNKITNNNFAKLNEQDLKPLELPEELVNMFEGSVYFDAVRRIDFNTLDKSIVETIFNRAKNIEGVRDIKYMIDRIRLLNAAQKFKGIDNEKIYNNTIAKLEGLYLKLKAYGEGEFLSQCSQSFSLMSKEEYRTKIYRLDQISRALGYHTLTQANRNFIRKYPHYSQLPFNKSIELIIEHPEDFFI